MNELQLLPPGEDLPKKKMRKAIEVLLGEEKKAWKVELWREKRETRRNI